MALVIPLASSAGVIENILFKVRRGIALSRNASQADPTTGVMADLPERIDFEMTLIKTHQAYTRNSLSESLDLGYDNTFSSSLEANATQRGSSGSKTETAKGIATESSASTGTDTEGNKSSGKEMETTDSGGTETETNNSSGVEIETNKSSGTEEETNKSSGTEEETNKSSGVELEVRCTNQFHSAWRYYDKFDTDTGLLEGISQ